MDTSAGSVPTGLTPTLGGSSILVAVSGAASGWRALDWASAESAARRCQLRIVHVVDSIESTWFATEHAGVSALQREMVRDGAALLERAEKAAGQPARMVDLPMSRLDIADYLGLTKETVSRVLAALKSKRLVRLDALDRVEVIDRRGLANIAEGHGGE